jgi:hypothetical protein
MYVSLDSFVAFKSSPFWPSDVLKGDGAKKRLRIVSSWLSMYSKGNFTENTHASSNKCTYTSIIRILRVKARKNVYRVTYFQKRLNGFRLKWYRSLHHINPCY